MQITDMLNQYNRTLANGTELSGGVQGIRQITSSLQQMSVGNIFEGSVNHMENGVVTLGLSDGKTIQARLDSGVTVRVGESMFFQVRSNNGAQIAIRPFSQSGMANPTLLNALKAANLPANGRMVTMVNSMMEQSMPIDKQSLLQMAKLVMGNERMDAATIVQMAKLGIPVTEEMAAQFENYKSDQYAILDQLESVMEAIPERLAGSGGDLKELLELNRQMIKVFLGEANQAEDGTVLVQEKTANPEGMTEKAAAGAQAEGAEEAAGGTQAKSLQNAKTAGDALLEALQEKEPGAQAKEQAAGKAPADAADMLLKEADFGKKAAHAPQDTGAAHGQAASNEGGQAGVKDTPELLKDLFGPEELAHLGEKLSKITELSRNTTVFSDGVLSGDLTQKELLQFLEQAFASKNPFSRQALLQLASSKEYRALIRSVMERQWLLKPEELKGEHKVSELYERLDRQMAQMEKVLKAFGQDTPQLSHTASNVRSNIQFMNQINQNFAYVQIPLKLAGQNAHSDIYVYTDKRKKREKDDELTAFLHLDLDHLGSTDVSVRLCQKNVKADFYLADDMSYQLILEHMDQLEERLAQKGFHAKIEVKNQKEDVNFVEDMLKQGMPSAGGMVHRYSFDVRA